MARAALIGGTAGGKFAPPIPTLVYLGSYLTNAGKFQITNYSASHVYTVGGSGSLSGDILTVTAGTGSATLIASSPNGFGSSPTRTAFRQAAAQTSVPYTQCYNPCGNCNTSVNPNTWSCGCGSGCNDSGGGQWGVCICRGPGYSYWNDYSGSGFSWSGANYASDGSNGEWWRIA